MELRKYLLHSLWLLVMILLPKWAKVYTVGPILIAWFNYFVLSFASEIVNLLIAFASHEARKVCYKQDTIAFPIIVNTMETRSLQLIDSRH